MSAYILPPVTAESLNATTARFGIDDGMLISSSVPEAPPATYNPGTTYVAGAEVSTGAAGEVIQVWRSKAGGNLGHAPASSPTWWEWQGDTYAVWTSGTWAEGARVIRTVPGTHAVYQRLATDPGPSATPPEAALGVLWSRVATTNRWAMFDMLSTEEPTVAPSPLVVVLAPGRISGLALLETSGAYVHMGMTSADGGGVVFDETESLDGTVINDWDDYFFAPFSPRSHMVRRDVPSYSDGVLTLTVTDGSGPVSIGKCVVGTVVEIGGLLDTPTVREKSFTTVERSPYGRISDINKQRVLPLVSGRLLCPKELVLHARKALRLARNAPCVFIGMDNDEDAYADLLTFPALCTDFEIAPRHKTHALISIELEGV